MFQLHDIGVGMHFTQFLFLLCPLYDDEEMTRG